MSTATIPKGYHQNAHGHLVPDDLIPEHDLLRDDLVHDLIKQFREINGSLATIKRSLHDDVSTYIDLLGEKYDVHLGGKKGNVTLVSYNGLLKVQRARAERVSVGPSILAAEQLISDLLTEWTSDARGELRVIIDRAFRRNKEGQLSVPRLIDLTKVEIKDERWKQACKAISDAMQEEETTTYFRAYERDSTEQSWRAISLDLASVVPAEENQ